MIIFDTDILSIFAKVNRLDLLKNLFSVIYITPMIREELFIPLEYGYRFPLKILSDSVVIIPNEQELDIYTKLRLKLGKGEAEAISIAKSRKLLFATNDKVAQKVAKENSVKVISLQAILKACWKKKILPKEQVLNLIEDIKREDNLIIPENAIENIIKE